MSVEGRFSQYKTDIKDKVDREIAHYRNLEKACDPWMKIVYRAKIEVLEELATEL